MRDRRRNIVMLVMASAAVVVLSLIQSARPKAVRSQPSTFDSGRSGYAALYELLQRERVSVDRFERPIGELFPPSTLVLAGDSALDVASPNKSSRQWLEKWVRRGGRLIVLGSRSDSIAAALGLPAERTVENEAAARTACGFSGPALSVVGSFPRSYRDGCTQTRAALLRSGRNAVAIAYRRGRGTIVVFPDASIFDNAHLGARGNAAFAYDLFAGRSILFDERVHGYAQGRSFWDVLPAGARFSIVLAIVAMGLAIAGANVPFVPPMEAAPPRAPDSSAYIASLAGMLQRGGAGREIVERLTAAAQQTIGARREPGALTDAAAELQALRDLWNPRPADIVRAGALFVRVRKEYGG